MKPAEEIAAVGADESSVEDPGEGEAGGPDPRSAPLEERDDLISAPADRSLRTLSTNIRRFTTSVRDWSRGSKRWKKHYEKYGLYGALVCAVITVIALSIYRGQSPVGKGPSCPNKWTKYDEICYFMSKNSSVWKESRQYCEMEGGSLLILNDTVRQQIEELFTLLQDHWIGLERDPGSKGWKWVNGSVYRGSVNYGDVNLNCAYINGNDIGALDCSTQRPWICMKSLWSGHGGGG